MGASSAEALTIIPVYDSSVTSLANAATVEAAFQAVANEFDDSFAAPVTVKIGVSWGKVNGHSLGWGNIAASQSPLTGPFSYSDVAAIFAADAASNPTDVSMALAAANLAANSPAGSLPYEVPYAQAQAIGFLPPTMNPDSGYVGFSSSTTWDYSPANGISTGAYDFQGLAAHEISEVLGRITGLATSRPIYATLMDALRYSAPGASSFSYSTPAYLSIDGGVTKLGAFNYSGAGDRSDWLPVAGDAQSAFLSTGVRYGLSSGDMTALDVLGWGAWTRLVSYASIGDVGFASPSDGRGVPEPGTWLLMLTGLGLVGAATRRRRRSAA